jgi:hypothetical protein
MFRVLSVTSLTSLHSFIQNTGCFFDGRRCPRIVTEGVDVSRKKGSCNVHVSYGPASCSKCRPARYSACCAASQREYGPGNQLHVFASTSSSLLTQRGLISAVTQPKDRVRPPVYRLIYFAADLAIAFAGAVPHWFQDHSLKAASALVAP